MTGKALITAVGVALSGIIILLLVRALPQDWAVSPLTGIATELSTAFIIAAVLLATIELFTKSEMLGEIRDFLRTGAEEISRAEFSKTLSDRITRDIFHQVDEFIIKQPYLIRDMKVNLEFRRTKPGYFELIDSTWFKVQNLTTAGIKDELLADEISELTFDYPDYPKVTRVIIDGKPRLEELVANSKIQHSENRVRIFLPLVLPPGGITEIAFTTEKFVRSSDSDIWNVTQKTTNLSIVCTGPEDLEMRAYPVHPDMQHFKAIHGNSEGSLKRWDMECGILPYQGIQLWWREPVPKSQ